MDIVSRIKFFLNEYKIANSQFADKCDIPRPTISQLLKGRNKKVSDEVISKIHAAYPNLSIMWLLFGEEPMLLAPFKADEHSDLFSSTNDDATNSKDDTSNRIIFDDDLPVDEPNIEGNESSNDLSHTLEAFMKSGAIKPQNNSIDGISAADKHIVNVMVFYSDNSFESFVPSR